MRKVVFAVCAVVMLLTSCTSSGGMVENMLSPPKLLSEQAQIIAALQDDVSKNISLVYPKNGSYRSAFVMFDLDGDGVEEAIAFYRVNAVNNIEGNVTLKDNVRINVLGKRDGAWRSLCDVQGDGTDIESINFAYLNGRNVKELMIGFTAGAESENTFVCYSFASAYLDSYFKTEYMSYSVLDYGENLCNKLVVLRESAAGQNKEMQIIGFVFDAISDTMTVPLYGETETYLQIKARVRPDFSAYIYIDEKSGDGYTTEVIRIQGGKIENLFYSKGNDAKNQLFYKSEPILCTDVNNDGYMDVATMSPIPLADGGENVSLVQWKTIAGKSAEDCMLNYYNVNYGFSFNIKAEWIGNIAAKESEKKDEISFYYRNGWTMELLVKIAVCPRRSPLQSEDFYAYEKAAENNVYSYYVHLPSPGGLNSSVYIKEWEIDQLIILRE